MQKIISAQFIKGVVGGEGLPSDTLPQIAFVGRSNVGKSSVINCLTGIKGLAISSSTPGRTLQLNFFLINEKVYFVDLPGYGYSKISRKSAEKMRKMIMWYLEHNQRKPQKVVLIVDANVGPTTFDLEMLELLREHAYDFLLVANKADKIKQSEMVKKRRILEEKVDGHRVIYFSTKTAKGKDEVLEAILP